MSVMRSKGQGRPKRVNACSGAKTNEMADNDFRSFRSREPATQNSAQGGARDRGYGAQTPPRGPLADPLAEIARLIGQREPAHNPDRGTRHHSSPPLTDAPPAQEWVDDRYAGASDQGHYAEQTQHDDQYQERSHDEQIGRA